MTRKIRALSLISSAFLWVVPNPSFAATSDLLIERSPQSLRGETIDLNDRWSGSRLLAHFGETKLAYEYLRNRPKNDPLDLQVERFEARLLTELELYARADSVLALQTYPGNLRGLYLHYLQRARLSLMAGRHSEVLGFLSIIETIPNPAFEPYKDFIAVKTYLESGEFDAACATGQKRLSKGVPLALSPAFEDVVFEAHLASGKLREALAFLEVVKARHKNLKIIGPVLAKEVDLRFMLGDTLEAVASALSIIKESELRDAALETIDKVISRVPAGRLPDEALLEFSRVLLNEKRLLDVERLLSTLAARPLTGNRAERRRFYLANLYYEEKRNNDAIKALHTKFTDPSLQRSAMLLLARIYRRTGQSLKAARTYEDFAVNYPYDAKAAEALFVAADLYDGSRHFTKSLEVLEKIFESYPTDYYGKLAVLRIVKHHTGRKDYARAAALLEGAVERSARRQEDFLFYLSEAYAKVGKPERKQQILAELKTLNPVSFYLIPEIKKSFRQPILASKGQIVLEGRGGLLEFLKAAFEEREQAYGTIRGALPPVEEDRRLETIAVFLERSRYFLQVGFRDWGEIELQEVEKYRSLPPRVWFELGVLYDDYAMPWKSVRAFQRVYYSIRQSERLELESSFKLLMYPIPFPAQVFENSARYGVSPHLVYAMIREESRFDLKAVSRAGAMGLMQLMPATGEEVANELGFPDAVQQNLFVPEINLTFGVWYAARLLGKTDGDPLMMLAAYNAGLGNAKRWFNNERGRLPAIAAVDEIDFKETRGYVKRIVESAHIYHSYYFGRDTPRRGGSAE